MKESSAEEARLCHDPGVDTPLSDSLRQKVLRLKTLLRRIETVFRPAAFASSFGVEDMVLLDLIAECAREIEVFTIDTGRLPPETHALTQTASERYRLPISVYVPDPTALEAYVRVNGVNGFRESVAQRKDCCHVRKVLPLARALAGKQAWLTGMRRGQGDSRKDIQSEEFDATRRIAKFNPLYDWTTLDVWWYVRHHAIPYSRLHDVGYASIGCAPCTRAIQHGEPERAGRWWWEGAEPKECGLHRRSPIPTI